MCESVCICVSLCVYVCRVCVCTFVSVDMYAHVCVHVFNTHVSCTSVTVVG